MSINTVTLSPSGEGDKLSFVGTNADERVIFSNPDRLYYAADLNLSGGNDQLASSDWMLEWARNLGWKRQRPSVARGRVRPAR